MDDEPDLYSADPETLVAAASDLNLTDEQAAALTERLQYTFGDERWRPAIVALLKNPSPSMEQTFTALRYVAENTPHHLLGTLCEAVATNGAVPFWELTSAMPESPALENALDTLYRILSDFYEVWPMSSGWAANAPQDFERAVPILRRWLAPESVGYFDDMIANVRQAIERPGYGGPKYMQRREDTQGWKVYNLYLDILHDGRSGTAVQNAAMQVLIFLDLLDAHLAAMGEVPYPPPPFDAPEFRDLLRRLLP